MMRMVPLLPFRFGHRPVAGERLPSRSVDRVKVRQVAAAVGLAAGTVLGEVLAVDGDQDAVAGSLGEFDHRIALRREPRRGENRQAKQRNGKSGRVGT